MNSEATQVDPTILASPERIVEECYRLISFPPGGEPQWDRFRQLFSPRAVLALRVFPDDTAITIMTLEEYVIRQMRDGMKDHGYSETVTNRQWSVFGDVAEARVDFEMKFGTAQPVPALDIFQVVHYEGRWWIVSIISEIKRGPQWASQPGVVS